jgi:heat shock 70kDa protein 1/2/6/8
LAPRSG